LPNIEDMRLSEGVDIQFLSKTRILGHGTTQMRCVQPTSYLARKGWRVRVGCIYRSLPKANKVMVFHRAILDAHTKSYLTYAKAKGLIIVYDSDDLIFALSGNEHLLSFSKQNQGDLHNPDLSKNYREVMKHCDVVLVSTNYLKKEAENFHSDVRLMKNGLAEWFSDKADLVNEEREKDDGQKITIAYLSGSKHHDLDFLIVEDVLLAILEDFPQAQVLIVGKLNFSDQFFEYGNRFQHRPLVLYKNYWKIFRYIDINIAPLRTDDPFVQARSEVKYMEAGIFGIPTVASPTETYAEAICDGQNGLLVNDLEWYDALKILLTDKEKRTELGEAARADVRRNYCHEFRSSEWDDLAFDIIRKYSRVSDKSTFSLSVAYLKLVYLWAERMARIGKRKIFVGNPKK
jgi:glycosyltransferase involved in cell wall biosynthesis